MNEAPEPNRQHRFQQPKDWLRLVMLGIIATDLAVLAFVHARYGSRIEGYVPGLEVILSGLLVGIIVIRIARPRLYADWIAVAILQALLGIIFMSDPPLSTNATFLTFILVFTLLAAMRFCIGAACKPGRASASLVSGGIMSAFCIAWIVVDRLVPLGVAIDVVMATDLLLSGISILGFGLALRPERPTSR